MADVRGQIDLHNFELEMASIDGLILELPPVTHQPGPFKNHRRSIGGFKKGVVYLQKGGLEAGNVQDATQV